MLKASQIATLINEIYDGVERSNLGRIIEECAPSEKFPDGKRVNQIPCQTFLSLLNNLVPKDFGMNFKEDLK